MVLGIKKRKLTLIMLPLVVFGVVFSFTNNSIFALDADNQTKTITITKQWNDNNSSSRPDDITVYLENSVSVLMAGCSNAAPNCSGSLEEKMKTLAGDGGVNSVNTTITSIKHATKEQYESVKNTLNSNNEVQSSGEKTYMWFDSGTLYYYSEANTIYLNPISGGLFRKMENLSDISGLSDLNTSYVTDMNRMFQQDISITDLGALANWDTSSVTNMRFTFGSNVTSGACAPAMGYTSLDGLSNWDVSSVSDFNQTFKCSVKVSSLAPLANWDMSSAKDVGQMFNRLGINTANGADVLAIRDWNVTAVTNTSSSAGGFHQFFQSASTNKNGDIGSPGGDPFFRLRSGYWTNNAYANNTYVTTSNAKTSPTPVSPGAPMGNTYTCSGSDWVKNGNTWTCVKQVPNDGATYQAWEDTPDKYIGECEGTTCTNLDRAIISGDFTITNTRNHTITYEKKITGNMAEIDKKFTFTIEVYDENGSLISGYPLVEVLGHDDTGSFTLSPGYSYKISEGSDGYDSYYQISGDGATPLTSGVSTGVVQPQGDQNITFTNNKEKIPVTGVFNSLSPFIIITSIAFVSIFGFHFIDRLKARGK